VIRIALIGAIAAAAVASVAARARAEAAAGAGAGAAAPAPEPAPDPAVAEAGDANLESIAPRKDFIVTAAIGGALSIGIHMDNATARGGAVTLRLAHVANARAVFATEIVASALFFSVSGHLYQTNVTNFLVAAQYYINQALWLRGAIGLGRYGGDQLRMGDFILHERFRYAGPAGSAGAGIDIIRLKRLRAGVEFTSTAMVNRDGVLSSNGLLFGLSID
jgi:hypothetical protein